MLDEAQDCDVKTLHWLMTQTDDTVDNVHEENYSFKDLPDNFPGAVEITPLQEDRTVNVLSDAVIYTDSHVVQSSVNENDLSLSEPPHIVGPSHTDAAL